MTAWHVTILVPGAQVLSLPPLFREQEDEQAAPSCYRMVASKLTFAFMELEIRHLVSAFSINSLALAATAFAESLMIDFNMMAVN